MPNQLQFNIEEINAADPGGVRGVVATSVVEALKSVGTMRGTTSQRDELYGIPSTPVAQLALQGRRYYNTELGGWQQYYAQRSTSNRFGATNAGWIDDDSGPIYVTANDFQNGWSATADGFMYRRINGVVTLSGIVNNGNALAASTVMVLPGGFRPDIRNSGLVQASAIVRGELLIQTSGTVTIGNRVNGSTGSVTITATYTAVL